MSLLTTDLDDFTLSNKNIYKFQHYNTYNGVLLELGDMDKLINCYEEVVKKPYKQDSIYFLIKEIVMNLPLHEEKIPGFPTSLIKYVECHPQIIINVKLYECQLNDTLRIYVNNKN